MLLRIRLFLVLGLTLLSLVTVGAAEPKTKILFIGKDPDHPFGSHMYLHTAGVLGKCVELTDGVQAVVSNGWPKEEETLRGVKTIVVYTNPGAELLLGGPHREQFDKVMKQGVGLVTIHWASSVLKKDWEQLGPAWMNYLGGTWVSNVGITFSKSPLKKLLPDHPISRGWTEFDIDDEFYLNPTLDKGQPLLQVKDKEGKDVIVGWVHERADGGRAFGTTLGHPYANFQREPFRRLIVNGILWTAKCEVPKDGAPVNVTDDTLKLPPEPKK